LSLLTTNCTGQVMTSYISIINGPRKPEDFDGPEEVYVVIIDNGRSTAYQDPSLRGGLKCIRCGRCMYRCPIWLRVGAYPYGWCYSGPIAKVLSPLLLGLDQTQDLYEACTLCGACEEICPVKVPHTEIVEYYREIKSSGSKTFRAAPPSFAEKLAFSLWGKAISSPSIFAGGLGMVKLFTRLLSKNGYVKYLPGPMKGWFSCRDLPEPPALSFHQRWKKGLLPKATIKMEKGSIAINQDGGGEANYGQ
jgi:L-lactate dehydrogenase complex protein LldF